MKYLKSVGIPVIYYILVETDDADDDAVLASGKQLVLDILEENWDDQFGYQNQVMEFEGFEWVQGAYVHTIEETDEDQEATEGGSVHGDGEVAGGADLRTPTDAE